MPAIISKFAAVSAIALTILASVGFASAASSSILLDSDVIVSKEFAAAINNVKSSSTWTASEEQGNLKGATKAQIKRLCGVKKGKNDIKLPKKFFDTKIELPASFDAQVKWPHCPTIGMIRDQANCGSCWAQSTTEAMSDRYCTYGINNNISFSAANVMECCWYCGSGCNGGQPEVAFDYAKANGLVTTACQPYPFPECAHHVTQNGIPPCPSYDEPTPNCPGNTCNNSAVPYTKYYFDTAYSLAGEESYMQELFTNGPFAVAFSVYADFPNYKNGVYKRKSDDYLGGHAVKVVGWGELNGEKYWKIANSWNAHWGMNGYFLIARGINECGIEESGAAGAPSKQ